MPSELLINLTNLDHNLNELKRVSGNNNLIPVLKANAYGHGANKIALHLKKWELPYIAFVNIFEAIEVKKAGYDLPILVMGGISPEEIPLGLKNGFTMSITSSSTLEAIKNCSFELSGKLHLKVDTGMNRSGVKFNELHEILENLKKILKTYKNLRLEAVYCHLVSAEEKENQLNYIQYKKLKESQLLIKRILNLDVKCHIHNSAGIINKFDFKCNFIRPGISIYGIKPNKNMEVNLKPILQWYVPISHVREVSVVESVSYCQSGKVNKKSNIATLIVGYGDGLSRLASCGKINAIINGKLCPSIGNVCMDMTMFNLGSNTAKIGDKAILIGASNDDCSINVHDMAKATNTIAYEVVCRLTNRNIRRYVY